MFVNFKGQIEWLKYLTVAFAVAYVIAFSVGPGSIPWLITAEIFASDARGRATSVATLVNWLSNFIVTTSIPLITVNTVKSLFIHYLLFNFLIIIYIGSNQQLYIPDIRLIDNFFHYIYIFQSARNKKEIN